MICNLLLGARTRRRSRIAAYFSVDGMRIWPVASVIFDNLAKWQLNAGYLTEPFLPFPRGRLMLVIESMVGFGLDQIRLLVMA
jgi:hypothetical protein